MHNAKGWGIKPSITEKHKVITLEANNASNWCLNEDAIKKIKIDCNNKPKFIVYSSINKTAVNRIIINNSERTKINIQKIIDKSNIPLIQSKNIEKSNRKLGSSKNFSKIGRAHV